MRRRLWQKKCVKQQKNVSGIQQKIHQSGIYDKKNPQNPNRIREISTTIKKKFHQFHPDFAKFRS